jgi:hypothetical protein
VSSRCQKTDCSAAGSSFSMARATTSSWLSETPASMISSTRRSASGISSFFGFRPLAALVALPAVRLSRVGRAAGQRRARRHSILRLDPVDEPSNNHPAGVDLLAHHEVHHPIEPVGRRWRIRGQLVEAQPGGAAVLVRDERRERCPAGAATAGVYDECAGLIAPSGYSQKRA